MVQIKAFKKTLIYQGLTIYRQKIATQHTKTRYFSKSRGVVLYKKKSFPHPEVLLKTSPCVVHDYPEVLFKIGVFIPRCCSK